MERTYLSPIRCFGNVTNAIHKRVLLVKRFLVKLFVQLLPAFSSILS